MRKKLALVSFVATTLLPTNPTQAQTVNACQQRLAQDIEQIIKRPEFKRSHWGIAIEDLEADTTIYELNSHQFFIPASVSKLATTAAALDTLGANFRITTPISAVGEFPHLETLRIEGQGDPTITTESLKSLAQQLKSLGLESIKELVIDNSYFPLPLRNPTWEWVDSYYYYAPPISSIILNQNTARLTLSPGKIGESVKLQWSDLNAARQWQVFNQAITTPAQTEYTVEIDGALGKPLLNIRGNLPQQKTHDNWDLAILDPGEYFLDTMMQVMAQEGIKIIRGRVSDRKITNSNSRIITQIYSPPLAELIKEINQESNNLYAEVILKILAKKNNTSNLESALKNSLSKLNINPEHYQLVDGSGLSRHNLITPQVLVDILDTMEAHLASNTYQDSLAIAGINGTLKRRFHQTILQNNLWAKTGSLSGTITLAGYVKLPKYNNLAIVILVNNFAQKNWIARQAMDEIILLLTQFQTC